MFGTPKAKDMKTQTSDADKRRVAGITVRELCAQAIPVLALCTWATWVPNATALGFRIPNQDAAAIARGNAFVATADNPSAIYYNPAGISQLEGQHVQIGSLFYLGIYGDFESPTGASAHNQAEVIPVPTLQYTITPENCPLSFGFGIYEPFGFSVNWPNEAPFRQEGIRASLAYLTINPVVAWKVLPNLSLAAGPTFNFSQLDIIQGVLPSPYMVPNDQAEFSGHNWSYGFNAGVLWQPHPQWSLGASYRSGSRMNYQGTFSVNPSPPLPPVCLNTQTAIEFPQIAIAGISYRPTTNWNFEFDLDWADWQSVDSLTIQGVKSRPMGWQSTFMYEVGITRYLGKGYFVSAGYFFSPSSTPDKFYTPLQPDCDLHIGSFGGGYRGQNWDWALAFQLIASGWNNVTVDPLISPTVNGRYRLMTPTLAFSVGYHF
jgi:long-chain fatty acid transport protein